MENSVKEKKIFSTIMKGLAGNFGGQIIKDDLSLRFTVLKKYSIKQISQAASWLLLNREKTFPAVPTTKEIIDAIDKVSGNLETKTRAHLECDKVIKNLKYFGRACPTVFKDKATQYLMTKRWNFHVLGMMSDDDQKWWRKDFVEAYQDINRESDAFIDTVKKGCVIPIDDIKKLGFKGKEI